MKRTYIRTCVDRYNQKMDTLPAEILSNIVIRLEFYDKNSFSLTCRYFHKVRTDAKRQISLNELIFAKDTDKEKEQNYNDFLRLLDMDTRDIYREVMYHLDKKEYPMNCYGQKYTHNLPKVGEVVAYQEITERHIALPWRISVVVEDVKPGDTYVKVIRPRMRIERDGSVVYGRCKIWYEYQRGRCRYEMCDYNCECVLDQRLEQIYSDKFKKLDDNHRYDVFTIPIRFSSFAPDVDLCHASKYAVFFRY